jgi:hypothetical protein
MPATGVQEDGYWPRMRERIRAEWSALTDEELEQTEGNWDLLVVVIHEKTGDRPESIEHKLRIWTS